jgi:hypothetical protein
MDHELRGVKGWLLTYVIIMAVVSPLISAAMVYRELYTGQAAMLEGVPMFDSLKTAAWAMVAFDALIGWFVAWRLVSIHNWLSVQLAIAAMWFAAVAGTIGSILFLTSITGASVGDVIAASGPWEHIRPFIFCLIWTSYLLKSQRVENTYRGGGEQAGVFE